MKHKQSIKSQIGERLDKVGLVHRSEVKAQLGVSDYILSRLVKEGNLKQVRLGRLRYIKQSTVDNYLKSLVEDIS